MDSSLPGEHPVDVLPLSAIALHDSYLPGTFYHRGDYDKNIIEDAYDHEKKGNYRQHPYRVLDFRV